MHKVKTNLGVIECGRLSIQSAALRIDIKIQGDSKYIGLTLRSGSTYQNKQFLYKKPGL